MSKPRVTPDDLLLAADWLDQYNDGQTTSAYDGLEDPAALTMFRVAAWLRAEAERREFERTVRTVATAHAVPAATARAAVRRVLAAQETTP